MREKHRFTAKFIESLKAEPKRYNVMDRDTRGLGVQVQPTGAVTFFHVRKVQGWPERTTLGGYPEYTLDLAREKAAELNGGLAKWKSDDFEGANPTSRSRGKWRPSAKRWRTTSNTT